MAKKFRKDLRDRYSEYVEETMFEGVCISHGVMGPGFYDSLFKKSHLIKKPGKKKEKLKTAMADEDISDFLM